MCRKSSHFWALCPLRYLFYSFRTNKSRCFRQLDGKHFPIYFLRGPLPRIWKKINVLTIFHCDAVRTTIIFVYPQNLVHPGYPAVTLAKIFGILGYPRILAMILGRNFPRTWKKYDFLVIFHCEAVKTTTLIFIYIAAKSGPSGISGCNSDQNI